MKKRWASDVGYGLLVAAVGMLITAATIAFFPGLVTAGLAITALGGAISLFGGFEYFMTRHDA